MITFLLGMMVGAIVGFLVFALCHLCSDESRQEEKWQEEHDAARQTK